MSMSPAEKVEAEVESAIESAKEAQKVAWGRVADVVAQQKGTRVPAVARAWDIPEARLLFSVAWAADEKLWAAEDKMRALLRGKREVFVAKELAKEAAEIAQEKWMAE